MKKEKNIKSEVVEVINGYTIVRRVMLKYDTLSGEYNGRMKVYYDICDEEEKLLEVFKTLPAAKRWCMKNAVE